MSKLRRWWFCWGPFVSKYCSTPYRHRPHKIDTWLVGWRRWAVFLNAPGAYNGLYRKWTLSWCNYFGEGEGG